MPPLVNPIDVNFPNPANASNPAITAEALSATAKPVTCVLAWISPALATLTPLTARLAPFGSLPSTDVSAANCAAVMAIAPASVRLIEVSFVVAFSISNAAETAAELSDTENDTTWLLACTEATALAGTPDTIRL